MRNDTLVRIRLVCEVWLARRLNEHGFEGETEASVNSKLVRGTFAVTFFLAVLAVLDLEGVSLADL